MNNISMQNISFCANPKDFPAIKKACDVMYHKVSSPYKQIQPVDIAEINGQVYLSSFQKNGKPVLKVNLTDKNGIESYTIIETKSLKNCKDILKSRNTIHMISDIIDSLKKSVKRASKSESYIG